MKVSESRARILLSIVLDGSDQGDGVRVPERPCDKCGNWLTRFEASPGLQRAAGVAAVTEACVTTSGYGFLGFCPRAAAAKPLLDALKNGTRR
jgi:hypothetical protein